MKSYEKAGMQIREACGSRPPEACIILGSGLSSFADSIENAQQMPYAMIEGFEAVGVEGHSGQLVLGDLHGRSIACLQGRWHAYEGHNIADLANPIRSLRSAGCDLLLTTCAAGSLNESIPPGNLMMLTDHINWTGLSPLVGVKDDQMGPRFTDMSHAYDIDLQGHLRAAAAEAELQLHEGVYLWCLGPSFETPAEIRAFKILGADAVGMSTVPETIAARHCGMKVAAVAAITNYAAGLQANLSHEQTLTVGNETAPQLAKLISGFFKRWGRLSSE